jgi:hypothetical protein
MPTICMGTVSLSDAEKLLADLWTRLERNSEATPALSIDFEADGTVTLWRTSPEDAGGESQLAYVAG